MKRDAQQKLLYFAPGTTGGLADYSREQAYALAKLGVSVDLLCPKGFSVRPHDSLRVSPLLTESAPAKSAISRRLNFVTHTLSQHRELARLIESENHRHVLLGSYVEYFAPLWAGPFQRLAARGVVFGAIVHDPVRDYVLGPLWWHRRSIASAYSYLREAFVHEPIALDTVRPMPRLHTTVIPHGPFLFPQPTVSREAYRNQLGIPDSSPMWLSFGHVRDGKNLDLVIRALAHFPDAFLVVAGKEQSSGQKPVAFYQDLARQCGVADRCRWLNRFIAPEEVGNLFAASDLVLLTYGRDFRSASGVLNAAVHFRKPCLASSGQGNLQTVLTKYQLGVWVEPDNVQALVDGLFHWQKSPPVPQWDAYAAANSWERNAESVRYRMFAPEL